MCLQGFEVHLVLFAVHITASGSLKRAHDGHVILSSQPAPLSPCQTAGPSPPYTTQQPTQLQVALLACRHANLYCEPVYQK